MARTLRASALLLFVCTLPAFAAVKHDLVILEADNTKLPLTVTQRDVAIAITIENRGDKTTVKLLKSALRDPQGKEYPLELLPPELLSAKGMPIGKFRQIVATLKATLPVTVKYTGSLRFAYSDQIVPAAALEITRNASASVVTLGDLTGKRVELPWRGEQNVDINVELTESGGNAHELTPALKSFVYKPDATHSVESFAEIVDASPVTVEPNGTAKQTVTLKGIRKAGEYLATIAYGQNGITSAGATKSVAIFAREKWRVAVAIILAGILAAFLLRIYLTRIRPLLVSETRIALILQTLREKRSGLTGEALALVERMHARVKERWDMLVDSNRAAGTTEFDIYDRKLPLLSTWLDHFRKQNEVPAAFRATFNARMKAAAQVLDRTTATADEVTASQSDLDKLYADIEEARRVQTKGPGVTDAIPDIELDFGGKSAADLDEEKAAAWLRLRTRFFDVITLLASTAIALLLGFKILYYGDLTWGGWPSYLAAFLWGFGMHTFTSGGVSAIWSEIRKVAT
jgi:hypothetical protein